jgi:hypothetical protein
MPTTSLLTRLKPGCLLTKPDVRWIIEVHSEPLEQACLQILNVADYTTKVIGHAWWRGLVPEARPIEHNRWIVVHRLEETVHLCKLTYPGLLPCR